MKSINLLAAIACATLVACGGGGGGGSTPVNVPPTSAATPLSTSNFNSVAGPSAASILSTIVTSDGADLVRNSVSGTSQPAGKAGATHADIAFWAMNTVKSKAQNNAKATDTLSRLAVVSQVEACPGGGSVALTLNDADNNEEFTAGDVLSLQASNCVFEAGQPSVNGGLSLRVDSIAYNTLGDVVSGTLTVTYTNFSSAGNTLNGVVITTFNSTSTTTSYQNFTNTRGNSAASILNYSATFSAGQLSVQGRITINNSTYTLSTPTPITFGSFYPVGGTLRITDAAGSRIDVISNPTAGGSLDCDLFLVGDNIRDGRISSTWAAL